MGLNIYRLIDCIGFYARLADFSYITASAINKRWSFVKASRPFIEIQWNGLLHAKEIVIFDMGHHLTSHPTDITNIERPS